MLFGYVRDTYDWVPVILFVMTVGLGIYDLYHWLQVHKFKDFTYIPKKYHDYWKNKRVYHGVVMILATCTLLTVPLNEMRHTNNIIYDLGIQYEKEGKYDLAFIQFENLSNKITDKDDIMQHYYYNYKRKEYQEGKDDMDAQNWVSAYYHFLNADEYLDSELMIDFCYYMYLMQKYPDWRPHMSPPTLGGK